MNPTPKRIRGFSLTELLVAMVVGLLLLGGLVTLMVNSKKNYAQQDYSARLQENARFAMQFLTYDIRMAGYFGCSNDILNDNSVVPVATSNSGEVTITYGEPYDATDQVTIDSANYDTTNPNVLILNDIPSDWSDTDGNTDSLVMADCSSASIADINTNGIDESANSVTVTPRNGGFGRVYDTSVMDAGPITVRRLNTNTYSVATAGESGVPVLTRNGQELVEGIENLRFLYQASAGDTFTSSVNPLGWPAAVQLGALVRSISNENLDPGDNREYGSGADLTLDTGGNSEACEDDEYPLLDGCVPVTPLRGQRRIFSTTLAVRNRTL